MSKRVIITKNGEQVASSKNLEVIMRYQRGYNSPDITLFDKMGNTLIVKYSDGAKCMVDSASENVLNDYLRKKAAMGYRITSRGR